LFLAGYKNQTLLAAGYNGDVDIEANKANIVPISLTPVVPVWSGTNIDGDDFIFTGSLSNSGTVTVSSNVINISAGPEIVPNNDTFSVTYNSIDLDVLADAEGVSDTVTIKDYKVVLYNKEGVFSPVILKRSGDTAGPYADFTTNAATAFVNVPATDKLPNLAVNAELRFELRYYPFGTESSNGNLWIIRNGLDLTLDTVATDDIGGNFQVKIRGGTNDSAASEAQADFVPSIRKF
jgi:hypothetical protein